MKKVIFSIASICLFCGTLFAQNYDATQDFSIDRPADSGIFTYGYGNSSAEFVPYTNKSNNRGVIAWIGTDGWHGIHKNISSAPVNMSQGLVFQPGKLVMHPGDKGQQLSIIRFTAPEDGIYKVDVKWTSIDQQAKKINVKVETNASAYNTGGKFVELMNSLLIQQGASAEYHTNRIPMKKGEIISFSVGNAGDRYFDDSAEAELTVSKQ